VSVTAAELLFGPSAAWEAWGHGGWASDVEVEALAVALAELSGNVTEAFDSAKHPRNPKGSPGGGRFRTIVDRLKDAITEHHKSGGHGDPFDGFDREQLRRVAKQRGHRVASAARTATRSPRSSSITSTKGQLPGNWLPPTPSRPGSPRPT
jgi:hypothetical protein